MTSRQVALKLSDSPARTARVTMECTCCYCGSKQMVPPPPSVHRCLSCKHEFRVYLAPTVGLVTMDLTDHARKFYSPGSTEVT